MKDFSQPSWEHLYGRLVTYKQRKEPIAKFYLRGGEEFINWKPFWVFIMIRVIKISRNLSNWKKFENSVYVDLLVIDQ